MKLAEIVQQTQNAEETFEDLAAWKLEQMAEHADPSRSESDFIGLQLYARTVEALGQNTDELIKNWPEYEK